MNSRSEEGSAGVRVVEIFKEPVELHKILKFEGLADSGGGAKAAIAGGQVSVNGVVETRKRKKIVAGDTIELGGLKMKVALVARSTVADGRTDEN